MAPDSNTQLCISIYSDITIDAWKKILYHLCSDGCTSRFIKRQRQEKNSHNIDDIIKVMQEKGSDLPMFVAQDLSKSQPITFHDIDV